MTEPDTRPSLLVRLRDPRDAAAWATFVEVYGPLVYGECRRRGLRHEDAEDVTQKVFARLVGGIRRFDYHRACGRFRAWLGTIVRHEVLRFRGRSGGPAAAIPDLDTLAAPDDAAWVAAYHARVLRVALDRCAPHFDPRTWAAFTGVWLAGRPAAEVAAELGQPLDWVYVAKSRALKRLHAAVAELADDLPVPREPPGSSRRNGPPG
jgi:RNA polymerase sigma-70 factor (ECF subfamily)